MWISDVYDNLVLYIIFCHHIFIKILYIRQFYFFRMVVQTNGLLINMGQKPHYETFVHTPFAGVLLDRLSSFTC